MRLLKILSGADWAAETIIMELSPGSGGPEVGNPPKSSRPFNGSWHLVCHHSHAAWTVGPLSIGSFKSRAVRIGHGVRSLEDPSSLSICESIKFIWSMSFCNVCLKVVPIWQLIHCPTSRRGTDITLN
jgi:hypothetical protein